MKKILVVEDDEIIRKNIVEILQLSDYKTIEAENGKIALDILSTQKPDIILCDVMMPEMSGFELLNNIQGIESLKTIPFLFLTAKTEWSDIRTGMNLGADDYIPKPVQHADLLNAIETRLSKAKKQSEKILEEYLQDASEGLHIIGTDGKIIWANDIEFKLLGYDSHEYIGRPVADFHVDQEIFQDIFKKLMGGKRITNCPARLKAKDGSIKHVLVSSGGFFREQNFSHTRCFTRDVTGLFDLTDMVEAQLKKLKAG